MPFFPTTHFPRHHLAQSLGAACIAQLWLLVSLSLRRSASLGFARLHLVSLSSASLSSHRSACVASLSLASWLAARITGSRHSACVGSHQLMLLGSHCSARVASQASLGFAWLASLAGLSCRWLALLASLALSLVLALSSHCSVLCLASRCFTWPCFAGSRCWLADCIAGSHHLACISSPRIAWLVLLCSRCEPSVTRLRVALSFAWLALLAGSHHCWLALLALLALLLVCIAGSRCWLLAQLA